MIPDYTPPAVIGSLPRDEEEEAPDPLDALIAHIRQYAPPRSSAARLLIAYDAREAALGAALALVARAEQRAPSFGGRAHEAVGEAQFAALAAALRLSDNDRAGVARLSQ